jgi:hypothetical protein
MYNCCIKAHLCHGVWLTTYTCMVCSALSIHVVSCESCCLGCYIYMFGLQCTVNPCCLMCVMLFGLLHIHVRFAVHCQSMLSHVCHAVGLGYSATIRTDGLLLVSCYVYSLSVGRKEMRRSFIYTCLVRHLIRVMVFWLLHIHLRFAVHCQSMLSHVCHAVWLATYICSVWNIVSCVSCCLACYIYMFGLEYIATIRTDVHPSTSFHV